MDGRADERDDLGETHTYYRYGQEPTSGDGAYAADGPADGQDSPPPGYRARRYDPRPWEDAVGGSFPGFTPPARPEPSGEPPPATPTPFLPPTQSGSPYPEPSDSPPPQSPYETSSHPTHRRFEAPSEEGMTSRHEMPSRDDVWPGDEAWPRGETAAWGSPVHEDAPGGREPAGREPGSGAWDDDGPYGAEGWAAGAYGRSASGSADQEKESAPRGAELETVPQRPWRTEPPGGEDDDRSTRTARDRHSMPLWQELPLLLVVAFCMAVLIRTFLLQAFYIPSGSMEETLLVGDRVLVNKIVYDVRPPERGEVIVFSGTENWAPENFAEPAGGLLARVGRTLGDLVGLSRPGEKDFIKRVIGLPGDRVSCCDPGGRVYVNGKGLNEPYVLNNSPENVPIDPRVCRSRRFEEVLVPPGQLFVMGDHRIVSQDSRCQGTVPIENVIGRAFVIVWPSGRWDTLNVPETFESVPRPVAVASPGRVGASLPGVGVAGITLPILAFLVSTTRTGRKPRWGRSTLRR